MVKWGTKATDYHATISQWTPFLVIVAVRALGAAVNIIYDCDEVYNYWEPLHYVLYNYGKQTWEYSPAYGLRSYLYILLHWIVALPAKIIAGDGPSKTVVFYTVRLSLGIICGTLEFKLIRAMGEISKYSARNLFFFLVLSAGMFCSSTSFLPSTFSMYAMMAASVGVLRRDMKVVIISAVLGVVVGWSVSAVAFIPFALYVLTQPNLFRWFTILGTSLIASITLLAVTDSYFYGKFTVSQWNFIKYNVFGGGQSGLYGTEAWHYYIKNGLNNFNIAFLLALALPLVALLAWYMGIGQVDSSSGKRRRDGIEFRMMVVCAPLYLWLPVISLLPHKEERFLFVVFPQICCAAAVTLSLMHRILSRIISRVGTKAIVHCILVIFGTLCMMRTLALLKNYGAPFRVFSHLQQFPNSIEGTGEINVCMGDEWFRFPSSFFLPSPRHRLHYLKQTFSDMLPASFAEHRGTTVAPSVLNDKNLEAPSLYFEDIRECDFVIDFEEHSKEHLVNNGTNGQWETIVNTPFLDASMSPSLYRALYIPWISQLKNHFSDYKMYRRMA